MCRKVHGRRVSNAWGTYLFVGNNVPKGMVIPHKTIDWDVGGESWGSKDLARGEGPASDYLVGGVTAHQGNDQ